MTRIQDESIDQAVLDVFRRCGVDQCGARLRYAELEHRWRFTGLRHSDLPIAVRRLERLQCLRVDRSPATGPEILLSTPGYRRLSPPLLSGREWVRTVRAYVDLAVVHSRAAAAPRGGAGGRRLEDSRSAPASTTRNDDG